jgi:thiol-disulfide isomerase/thioredoxin
MHKYVSGSIIILIAALAVTACTPINNDADSTTSNSNANTATSIVNSNSETDTENAADNPTQNNNQPGVFTEYNESLLANAENGNVVLFFSANWCPTCRALKAHINDNKEDIPSDLTILEVDYDTTTELKKKYGVTYQHTLVQVDANGEQITKWSGGNTLGSIETQLQ